METITATTQAHPIARFAFLKAWVVASFALDIATTAAAFQLGAVEANPIMAGWSIYAIAAAKALVLGALLCLRQQTRTNQAILFYAATATSAVVAWNLYQFMRYAAFVGIL